MVLHNLHNISAFGYYGSQIVVVVERKCSKPAENQHFHNYCSSKNVLFMGQNDLDPRTIDLNLNVNLAIEILYQYEYVAQVERLNYGTMTACLRKGFAFRCKIK